MDTYETSSLIVKMQNNRIKKVYKKLNKNKTDEYFFKNVKFKSESNLGSLQ